MVKQLFQRTSKNILRLLVALCIVILLIPVGLAGLSQDHAKMTSDQELRQTATNVTFVSSQGGVKDIYKTAGSVVAVHTDTKRIIWKHDKYRRYMDVDPIGPNRVLFVAGKTEGRNKRVAVMINWRSGKIYDEFEIPKDTHDIDYLDNNRYAIADKQNDRVYVYNSKTNTTVWEYKFENHFPTSAGGKLHDWTHLNDIDTADNGSAFVVSPRNFDRVMQINRSTKNIDWTLGKKNAHNILYEQHNPVVLQLNPLTVLVADSENNRVVEYQRKNGNWKLIWGYQGQLYWPRDADRLPNGNTLIADTHNDRVVEITPDRKVVWEFHIERSTYDVERLEHGDEPAGPTMASMKQQFGPALPQSDSEGNTVTQLIDSFRESFRSLFQIVTWVLPAWITIHEFGYLFTALLLFMSWIAAEAALQLPIERVANVIPARNIHYWLIVIGTPIGLLIGGSLIALIPNSSSQTSLYLAIGMLLLVRSIAASQTTHTRRLSWIPQRIRLALFGGIAVLGLSTAGVMVFLAVEQLNQTLLGLGLGLVLVLASVDVLRQITASSSQSWRSEPTASITKNTSNIDRD